MIPLDPSDDAIALVRWGIVTAFIFGALMWALYRLEKNNER